MLPWSQEGSECWRSVDPPSSLGSPVCLYYWLLYSPPIFCFDYRWSILLVCFLLIPLSTLALFLLDEEDNLLCSVSHENFFSNHLPGSCLDSNSPRPVRRGWDTFWVIIPLLLWFICYYGWLEGLYLTVCNSKKITWLVVGWLFKPALIQQTPGGKFRDTKNMLKICN